MQQVSGVVAAAGTLLVVAGVPKTVHPHETARALRSVGASFVRDAHARLLAVAEVVVGALVVLTGLRVAVVAAALLYAGFTAFLVVALRRGGVVSSCGCAGRPDTPPTWGHLVLTVALATACTVGAAGAAPPLHALDWSGETTTAVLTAVGAAVAAWLGWLVLTLLPRLTALRSPRTTEPGGSAS